MSFSEGHVLVMSHLHVRWNRSRARARMFFGVIDSRISCTSNIVFVTHCESGSQLRVVTSDSNSRPTTWHCIINYSCVCLTCFEYNAMTYYHHDVSVRLCTVLNWINYIMPLMSLWLTKNSSNYHIDKIRSMCALNAHDQDALRVSDGEMKQVKVKGNKCTYTYAERAMYTCS